MYDTDALTITHEQVGPGTYQFLATGTIRYVLGVGVQQSGTASDTLVKCGNNLISRNYGKDANFQQMSYRCTEAITLDKTGNDSAFITITYIERDLSLTTPLSISSSVSATINNQQFGIFTTSYILILFALGLLIGLISLR